MSNEFLTTQAIARKVLPRLYENLVMPNLMYNELSSEYQNIGDTIRVRKPINVKVDDFNPETGVNYQSVKDEAVYVTLDRHATADFEWTSVEKALQRGTFEEEIIEETMISFAEKINREALELYKDIPYSTGTAGVTMHELEDIAVIRKELNKRGVQNKGRVTVLDSEAECKLLTIPSIVNAEKSGTNEALRDASIGKIYGFDNYSSQGIAQHKTGITASDKVKIGATAKEGAEVISLSATTLTGKLVKGDLLTILGESYTVVEDTEEAVSNAISNVKIYPALKSDVTTTTNVTLVGDHTANLAFVKEAFAFVTAPLPLPTVGDAYVLNYNGLSLRVVKGYDQRFKKETLSIDMLYGFKTLYPELAERVLG